MLRIRVPKRRSIEAARAGASAAIGRGDRARTSASHQDRHVHRVPRLDSSTPELRPQADWAHTSRSRGLVGLYLPQILTVACEFPLASRRPSGLTATQCTTPECPFSVSTS